MTTSYNVFAECVRAIDNAELIQRVSAKDKEFHFQNWFQRRLEHLHLNYDEPARNAYPDFRLVDFAEGFELKGLAVPGRERNYDSNSQVPKGLHHGRAIFYVFGRYPKDRSALEYPVIDLVLCHGDFLNIDREYIHLNKSIKGFGSFGDIMIRDRKMYVVPHPFDLTLGTIGAKTLILPQAFPTDERFVKVGDLVRSEANEIVVGYNFDLQTNNLVVDKIDNPSAGMQHHFCAYRLQRQSNKPVSLKMSRDPNLFDAIEEEADE